jgi:L-ascorbate metabolism protein UlaG (beta-lactamase superfamily)
LKPVTRRRLLSGAALALGAGALEYASLAGKFDHLRSPGASGKGRYLASLAQLAQDPAIIHVGHSTHLVSLGGARLLTDPWFFDPGFGALEHDPAPAVLPDDIGELAAVLISHDHADHADLRAIDRLDKRAAAVVATSDLASRVRALGFAEVHVLAPWDKIVVRGVTVHAVPAQHDIYEVGYVLEHADAKVYFAGDTRLFDAIAEIRERHLPDVAILPVDGTRLTGGAVHVMDPDTAVAAARILGVRLALPSHAEARFCDPLARYALASTVEGAPAKFAAAMARGLPGVRCEVPAPGATVRLRLPA